MDELFLEEPLDENSFELLSFYNPEPVINMDNLTMTEISILQSVMERSYKIGKIEKFRSKKYVTLYNKYNLEYSCYDRSKCSFCSIPFIPVLTPIYSCVRCFKLVCIMCSFTIDWAKNVQRNICLNCYMKIVCDNRTGKWFEILSKDSERKRIAPEDYLLTKMNKQKSAFSQENIVSVWAPINDTIYRLEFMNEQEKLLRQTTDPKLIAESLADGKSTRRSTINMIEILKKRKSSAWNSSDNQNLDKEDHVITPATIKVLLKYNINTSYLNIDIIQCFNLPKVDDKLPNSFIKIDIVPLCEKYKSKTKVINSKINPLFRENFRFRISGNKVKSMNLIITVWYKRKMKKDKFMGEVIVPISEIMEPSNTEIRTYTFKNDQKKKLENETKSTANAIRNSDQKLDETDISKNTISDTDLFKNEPTIYFTMKALSNEKSFGIEINLLLLLNFHSILSDVERIQIAIYLNYPDETDTFLSDSIILEINESDVYIKMDEKLTFSDIDKTTNLENMFIKLEVTSENGEMIAYSCPENHSVIRSINQNMESDLPLMIKMKQNE